jgi:hypothetical protein
MSELLLDGYVFVVDDDDSDLLQMEWRTVVYKNGVYALRNSYKNGTETTLRLHRLILERKLGRSLSEGELSDHRDLNTLNNRRSNLRAATRPQNNANCRRRDDNKTGYKGVYRMNTRPGATKPFIAQCGKQYLGTFATAEEAHAAYRKAAGERYGEFANFGATP